jgi:signal transduction histidine kinase
MDNTSNKTDSVKEDPRFGTIAVGLGFITEEQLKIALNEQIENNLSKKPHNNIGNILLKRGWITYDQIIQILDKARIKDRKVFRVIKAIKRDIRVLNSVVLLIVFSILLINLNFLSEILDYVPSLSVSAVFLVMAGLVIISQILARAISNKAISELEEYDYKLNSILISLQGEIKDRKTVMKDIKRSRDTLRHLVLHLESAREKERTVVAREIHDELGQYFTAFNMDLSWLAKKLPESQKPLIEKIASMAQIIKIINKKLQNISSSLRPDMLDDLGLVAAIEWLIKGYQERTGIECHLITNPREFKLNDEISTTVYRIFQEALTNAARHADATKIRATITIKADIMTLKINDNGRGITESQIAGPESFGLVGIRERIYSMQGSCEIKGIKDKGTTIVASIPVPKDED